MRTLLEILNLSISYLENKGISHPRRQAEDLLSEALGMNRMGLYLDFDRPLTDAELDKARSWLKRRGEGEPLAYISKNVDFFGCKFAVQPDVLIPRQETEILVDKIVRHLKKDDQLHNKVLWDVCCGSGCIGIAIKKKCPELKVVLADISLEALEVAKRNSLDNGVEVELILGDLLAPFTGKKCDYFVCNPPYIAESEFAGLDKEVKDYEPKRALVSGSSGLEFYERLAQELPSYLNSGAKVWFEIGTGQGEALKELFKDPFWKRVEVENDWSGHNRFFSLEIE